MINRPYFVVFVFTIVLLGLNGCALNKHEQQLVSQNQLSPISKVQKGRILVVNSNKSIERYQIAESVFSATLRKAGLHVVNLENENQPIEYLQDILNQNEFDSIYCIGAKALGSIEFIDPETPVVYTAVLNWRKFKDHDNYFGISSELSPQVQLTWMKYFFQNLNKVGVFYSHENDSLIEDAQKVSENLSLKLMPVKLIEGNNLIDLAEKVMPKLDALWLISDSKTLSSTQEVAALFALADKLKVPIFTYNPLFMDIGALMSFAADLPTTARQASLITMKLLAEQTPSEAIQFPAGSRISLNRERLKQYQMKLNPGVLDSVDELR